MFKVAWIARFAPGMSKEDARRHWAEVHARLCVASSIPRYVQNHVVGPLPSAAGVTEETTHFDGYSCGWWPDEAAFRRTMEEPEWQALVDDGDNVFDMEFTNRMSAQVVEHTIVDGPASPYKVAWVAWFRKDMDPEEARTYWREVHGPLAAGAGVDRYVQNHAIATVGGGGEGSGAPAFAGFSECWFRDERHFLEAVGSDAWARVAEDGPNVFDPDVMWGAALEERVVRAGDVEGLAARS